jgi:hypothetical protein
MPGTIQGKLRIRASDGVNTAQDESDGTFTLPDKPPVLLITSPLEGASYIPGQPVALIAQALDLEDGTPDDSALAWVSSLDGPLGTGYMVHVGDLITGTHTITVTLADSGGNLAAEARTISVGQPRPGQDLYLPLLLGSGA